MCPVTYDSQVQTIAGTYMAVSGVPESQKDHAERMAKFALTILKDTEQNLKLLVGLFAIVQAVRNRKITY